ncbi:Lecithin retinol acyltransferase, partial [Globisporangium splendens]
MAHALNRFVSRLEVGDVVRFPRGHEGSHVALYVGDAKVIHHWSPSSSERAKVRVDPMRRVQIATTALPEFYTTEMDDEILDERGLMPFDGREAVERAKRKLGDRTCTDCVDFVTWARYGSAIATVHEQAQSDTRASSGGTVAGVVIGTVVVGIAGLVVGGLLALLKGNESDSEEEDHHRRRHPPSRTLREDSSYGYNSLEARRGEHPSHSHDVNKQSGVVSSHSHEFVNHRHDVLVTRLAEDELQCGLAGRTHDGVLMRPLHVWRVLLQAPRKRRRPQVLPILQRGDVVRFNRGEYSHVGIYVGRAKVIHLWSPTESDFEVRIDTLRRVQLTAQQDHYHEYAAITALPECYTVEMDARMRLDHDLMPFEGEEVVHRAMQKLGEREYNYLSNNCEHFVTWARYGFGASPQARSHTNQVLAGALLGGVVGGIVGFVAGGMLSLFLKSDALSASAGLAAGASAGSSMVQPNASREETHRYVDTTSSNEDSTAGSSSEDESDSSSGMEARREQRARLWGDLDNLRATHSLQSEELSQLDEWVESRRRHAAAASSRQYSDDRHHALATRLTEDELQCGLEISTVDEVHKSTKMRAKNALLWS